MTKGMIKEISSRYWVNRWAGSYTFISCSYWGRQYHDSQSFNHTLFIHHRGAAAFYAPQDELTKLGRALAGRVMKNPKLARQWCNQLKKNTDIISVIMKKWRGRILDWPSYQEFHQIFDNYLPYHVFVKKTVDYLPPAALKKFLPYFNDARLYAEATYSETERFWRSVMKAIAKQEGRDADTLTGLTQTEFERYLQTRQLPSVAILKKRFAASVLYFDDGQETILSGDDVKLIEKLILRQSKIKGRQVRGISAYPGKVTGRARIVLDPFKVTNFNKNEILITGMTRPEFLPLIKKAAAIITDAGGILCHAAITARELHIPCVVGTAVATKVFKDGDRVEVDATNGVVRKL